MSGKLYIKKVTILLFLKNVSRIDVDGNKLILRDIMGDERVVEGTILMVDLANSIVKLKCD